MFWSFVEMMLAGENWSTVCWPRIETRPL